MNTEHLRYLVTIAECQSISRAAEHLMLKQQYLSTLVKSLEEYFDTQIFERHHRGVTLTPNGQYLIDQMRPIVEASDRLMLSHLYPENQHYREDDTTIHFYTAPQISIHSLNKVIFNFRQTFPQAVLIHSESTEADIITTISNTPLSLATLSILLSPEEMRHRLPQEVLSFFLCSAELVALTSSNNRQAQQQSSLSCRELLEKDLLIYTNSNTEDSLMYKVLAPYGEVHPKCVVKNASLFWDTLHSSRYYSLSDRNTAQQESLQAISLKEHVQICSMLIANRQCLDSFIGKSLINMFLLHYGHPAV